MGRDWYHARDDRRHGPTAEAELREMAKSGKLTATDLVWTEGMTVWVEAAEIPGLLPEESPPPCGPDAVVPTEPRPPQEVRLDCPTCRAKLKAGGRHAGSSLRCPRCRTQVVVPKPLQAGAALQVVPSSQLPTPSRPLDTPPPLPAHRSRTHRRYTDPVKFTLIPLGAVGLVIIASVGLGILSGGRAGSGDGSGGLSVPTSPGRVYGSARTKGDVPITSDKFDGSTDTRQVFVQRMRTALRWNGWGTILEPTNSGEAITVANFDFRVFMDTFGEPNAGFDPDFVDRPDQTWSYACADGVVRLTVTCGRPIANKDGVIPGRAERVIVRTLSY